MKRASRRSFLKGAAAGLALGARASRPQTVQSEQREQALAAVPTNITRTWLGPAYWANRLQDWRLHEGRIECLAAGPGDEVRTVALLTHEIGPGPVRAVLSVRAGLIEDGGRGGFCGFLIGAGEGKLDYRAAALAHKASGTGGGILCTYETDGRVRLRDHASEDQPLAFTTVASGGNAAFEKEVRLVLTITSRGQEVELELTAFKDSQALGAVQRRFPASMAIGGIALVSSPRPGPQPTPKEIPKIPTGARFWFRDLQARGLNHRPERAVGPILGTLYSLNGNVLKLSAQFMPLGEGEAQAAKFQYRMAGPAEDVWRDGPTTQIGPGYSALFRLDNWDAAREWECRVVYGSDVYTGVIRQDPGQRDSLTIGLFSCTIATARSLEGGLGQTELPQAEVLGRYTAKNIYFPHADLVRNSSSHRPDLLVFAGDQLYEGNPTRRDSSLAPTLDYLYKWYLWLWSFREMTRNTPAILMVDDHDVYHGNIWGNGGRLAPERDQNRGGYRCTGEFVNIVQRTQCGHNPDPDDPTPVEQGITVYYGGFRYGGVSFAILEDRKFKTAPIQGADLDVHEPELLGERQEKFLAKWGKDREGAAAKICLTQTLFACLQTSPSGRPLLDFDANGYPKIGRDRAIELLRQARALVLAGDQHLASLVRHGLDNFTDGVVQFTGPAAGSSWQRWFEPARPLPNPAGAANTGDFTDAFGNKVRVLAIANPKVSFAEYRKYIKGRGQGLGDRRLKSEGYGIIRVNKKAREFVIECWPWNVDPAAPGAQQFPGWPYRLPF